MRRSFVTLGFLASFQLLAPAPAHAFVRYIWELTGPGPFLGLPDLQLRLLCFGDRGSARAAQTYTLQGERARLRKTLAAVVGAGCLTKPGFIPTASLNVEVGVAWALHNHLTYEPGVKSDVRLTLVEPTMTFNLDPNRKRDAIEVGFGAGLYILSGSAFETFTRPFYEPIRVDFRPFPGRGRAFAGKFGLTVIPKGFDDQDFGAKPGTFNSRSEVRPTFGVTIDPYQLFGAN